jgi:hypothetical protein
VLAVVVTFLLLVLLAYSTWRDRLRKRSGSVVAVEPAKETVQRNA